VVNARVNGVEGQDTGAGQLNCYSSLNEGMEMGQV
jgi:hypothetical protein